MNEEAKETLLSLIEQINKGTIKIDEIDKHSWRQEFANEPHITKTKISITIIKKKGAHTLKPTEN
ncbi:hypothetical protein [Streptococcus parauberis]|uniref:hypothetical protein n=1 Tax=Streptococcus parauberis TaxID=1348 RepID=UPI000E3081B5|nr:hypothetical protein [Streptococcus parauberis]